MSATQGKLVFDSFAINVCLGENADPSVSSIFVVHRKSARAKRVFSGGIAEFRAGEYLRAAANSASVGGAESDGQILQNSTDLEHLKDEIAQAREHLFGEKEEGDQLADQLSQARRDLEKLQKQTSPVDLVGRSLMHFGDELEAISWAAGVSKTDIAKLVVDSLVSPTPASILAVIRALREYSAVSDLGGAPLASLSDYIMQMKLGAGDCLREEGDIAVASFQKSISLAEAKRKKEELLSEEEVERLEKDLHANEEEQKRLTSAIRTLESRRMKLEEGLSKAIRSSLESVGIFPKSDRSTRHVLEEIVKLTFTHPYSPGKFDVLDAALQGKFSASLARALIAKLLNDFGEDLKTCCFNSSSSCNCDVVESSRIEILNRFNLTWPEWKSVLKDRGQYCWPLNLLDHLSILKDMAHYYHHTRVMEHFMEAMFAPSWATRESVVRNRINMPQSLSVQEEATLNTYLRQKFGFSRSDAVEALMKGHPGLKGKTPAEVMLMVSFMVGYRGVEETGDRLAALVQQTS